MPEIGTSGLTSGDGKRGRRSASVLAPILDSTGFSSLFSEILPDPQLQSAMEQPLR